MHALQPCLGNGNTKVGALPTFSLPSGITCPGASAWCRKHCYGQRFERLRPNCRFAYARNLQLSFAPADLADQLTKIIPPETPCLRLHVTGDFYSAEYISAWHSVCVAHPTILFWAYTRSWAIPKLMASLEELRSLENVQLFGSTDPTMCVPPSTWRVAFIADDPRANGITCKKQCEKAESCMDCGYCYQADSGNVIFKAH